MMSQEEAAKYMIVAWVKDWNLYTYLKTVTGSAAPDCTEAHKVFEWLPHGKVQFSKKYVRSYIDDNFPKLSENLWDVASDKDRLALFKMVMRPVGENHHVRKDPARIEARKAKSAASKSRFVGAHRKLTTRVH